MNIIIFGATRGVGRQIVEQALEQGHRVTAFARDPAALDAGRTDLQIIKGDVLDAGAVEKSLAGQEVVISAIGAPPSDKTGVREAGTRNIIRAMETAGVNRLISVSTYGAAESRAVLPFLYKHILVPLFLRRAFADHDRQEEAVRQSRLDWTLLRPAALTDGELTGRYRHGFAPHEKKLKFKISRADVADFALKQLTGSSYLHQAPGLSY